MNKTAKLQTTIDLIRENMDREPAEVVDGEDAHVIRYVDEANKPLVTFELRPGDVNHRLHPGHAMEYHIDWFEKSAGGSMPYGLEDVIEDLADEDWQFIVIMMRHWKRSEFIGTFEMGFYDAEAPLHLKIHIGHVPKPAKEEEQE